MKCVNVSDVGSLRVGDTGHGVGLSGLGVDPTYSSCHDLTSLVSDVTLTVTLHTGVSGSPCPQGGNVRREQNLLLKTDDKSTD